MVERDELARAGVSDLDVGYSARSAAEWDQLAEALEVFELVETTADHVRRARQVSVLHYDADFDRIAAATGQPCRWVVPAGSAD